MITAEEARRTADTVGVVQDILASAIGKLDKLIRNRAQNGCHEIDIDARDIIPGDVDPEIWDRARKAMVSELKMMGYNVDQHCDERVLYMISWR